MEEIDIIELLKRVKEGKAPKRIRIGEVEYTYNENLNKILLKYSDGAFGWLEDGVVCIDTKIKILDEPKGSHIIKEIDTEYSEIALSSNDYAQSNTILKLINKVNEIIRYINKEEK